MSRPLSSPLFADSPGGWFAKLRLQAKMPGGPPSPEQLGAMLGVSGTTVRRWESGRLAPTDEDLIRFGYVCNLSHHQIDFLRTAFSNFKAPLPPDPVAFRENTLRRLTHRAAPMVLFDQLLYVRAWNSYVSVLGDQALAMVRSDLHPLENLGHVARRFDNGDSEARIFRAIRQFWRLTAFYYGNDSYKDLIERLSTYKTFREVWSELASTPDTSEIDLSGVGALLLPAKPKFDLLPSLVIYPPVYTVIEFEPGDEESAAMLKNARERLELTVEFSPRDHWTQPHTELEPAAPRQVVNN